MLEEGVSSKTLYLFFINLPVVCVCVCVCVCVALLMFFFSSGADLSYPDHLIDTCITSYTYCLIDIINFILFYVFLLYTQSSIIHVVNRLYT